MCPPFPNSTPPPPPPPPSTSPPHTQLPPIMRCLMNPVTNPPEVHSLHPLGAAPYCRAMPPASTPVGTRHAEHAAQGPPPPFHLQCGITAVSITTTSALISHRFTPKPRQPHAPAEPPCSQSHVSFAHSRPLYVLGAANLCSSRPSCRPARTHPACATSPLPALALRAQQQPSEKGRLHSGSASQQVSAETHGATLPLKVLGAGGRLLSAASHRVTPLGQKHRFRGRVPWVPKREKLLGPQHIRFSHQPHKETQKPAQV